MLPTTTFRKLREAEACKPRYRRLAKKLGGIRKYGRDTPITLVQLLKHNGLEDTLWAISCSIDATPGLDQLLRMFACDCAERALLREREAGREPDQRSWDAVAVARSYTEGKATSGELDAVRDAAGAAARDAARAAARDAAWAAARAAARDAAGAVSRAASRAAAGAAARAGAWDAARAAAWDAAWDADWDAAWDAETEWQTQRLIQLLEEEPCQKTM
jgi:hypothetical protein